MKRLFLQIPSFFLLGISTGGLVRCNATTGTVVDNAAANAEAKLLYKNFIEKISMSGLKVATGEFGSDMQIQLINDGPVTFILER